MHSDRARVLAMLRAKAVATRIWSALSSRERAMEAPAATMMLPTMIHCTAVAPSSRRDREKMSSATMKSAQVTNMEPSVKMPSSVEA